MTIHFELVETVYPISLFPYGGPNQEKPVDLSVIKPETISASEAWVYSEDIAELRCLTCGEWSPIEDFKEVEPRICGDGCCYGIGYDCPKCGHSTISEEGGTLGIRWR